MYPNQEDDPATTAFTAPVIPHPEAPDHRMGRRGRMAITAGVAVALIAAGTGLGVALSSSRDDGRAPNTAAGTVSPTTGANSSASTPGGAVKPDKGDREAWARKYGQDRGELSNLPDVASATPEQRAAASDLLTRLEAATGAYSDVNAAKAAGFDVQATVANAEQHSQKLAARISQADATGAVNRLPLLPVRNKANLRDGKVLDPSAPEALLYAYQGHNAWKLVGAVFAAHESYPQAPPDPGGPITRWTAGKRGGAAVTMRVFFVPGNDLAHAYALTEQSS